MPETLPPLIDSHCHLTWPSFDEDRPAVIQRMHEAGVAQAVVIATTIADAHAVRDLCAGEASLFPTAGIHPNDLPEDLDAGLAALSDLVASGDFVAVGETGLDYYRDATVAADQQRSFRAHCALACEHDLPVVVHIRDQDGKQGAYDDVAEIIESYPGLRGVIHCFTGDAAHAARYLRSDFVISFSGILTFPKGGNVREAAAVVPVERMLVETDAPFLAPVPRRGKRNEPAYVAHTARAMAELKGLPEEDLRRITTENSRRVFRLPVAPAGHPEETS